MMAKPNEYQSKLLMLILALFESYVGASGTYAASTDIGSE